MSGNKITNCQRKKWMDLAPVFTKEFAKFPLYKECNAEYKTFYSIWQGTNMKQKQRRGNDFANIKEKSSFANIKGKYGRDSWDTMGGGRSHHNI